MTLALLPLLKYIAYDIIPAIMSKTSCNCHIFILGEISFFLVAALTLSVISWYKNMPQGKYCAFVLYKSQ